VVAETIPNPATVLAEIVAEATAMTDVTAITVEEATAMTNAVAMVEEVVETAAVENLAATRAGVM
jgi:hypothetical protein